MAASTAGDHTATDPRGTGSEALCPQRLIMEHVTSRWGVVILIGLLERSHRFGELRRAVRDVGRVSEKMLAQTLRNLERDGLVHREAKSTIPRHVEYSLTDLGREAAEQVRSLAVWTDERNDEVQAAREKYDAAKQL
jgi:DNA-binding HxlR family transcriptional regulator